MHIYRVSITEYMDIEAESDKQALDIFHDELTKLLNSGHYFDTQIEEIE